MRRVVGVLGLVLPILLASWLSAAAPPRHGGEVLETFAIHGDGDFLIVPVTIQGKQYPFIVDTGASSTVYDTSLRHLLGRHVNREPVVGIEATVEVDCYIPPEARLGKLPLPRNRPVYSLDLAFVRQGGVDVRGILGMDFLRHYAVRIDFDAGTLAIMTTGGKPEGQSLELDFGDPPLPGVHADVVGVGPPERFTVDTGLYSGIGYLQTDLFNLLSHCGKLTGVSEGKAASLGHEGAHKYGWLPHFGFGPARHESLLFGSSSTCSRLGLGFLKRYRVTLDFPASRLYLRVGKQFNEPIERNRSGLTLHCPGGQAVVLEVDAGSAAALAGIKPGDEVLSIAELPAKRTRLLVLRRQLCVAGQTIPVTLKRDGKLVKVSLKLAGERPITARANGKP